MASVTQICDAHHTPDVFPIPPGTGNPGQEPGELGAPRRSQMSCELVTAVTVFVLRTKANWKVTNHHSGPRILIPKFLLEVFMPLARPGTAVSFKNILFLTDFGQASTGALAYSLAFARHFKSRLYPAHVLDTVLADAATTGEAIKELEVQKYRQLSRLPEYNGI